MVSLLGILRDEGEAGGRGGSSGYTCSDESYSANDMSRNEMGYRTAVTNVCHSTDETHHGSQIADDGQGIFCRRTIRVDNLPDDGTCRSEQRNTYHS